MSVDLSGKHVALVVDDYFEQAELVEPKKALEEVNALVDIVSIEKETVHGLNHIEMADLFKADRLIDDADFNSYDAIIIPGGAINSDSLRMNATAQKWVRQCMEENKPLAVICHGPWLLASAGVVDGRTMTSFPSIQDDLKNAGAQWVDQEVVVDNNLITSRNPDDIPAFNKALIGKLVSDE